MTTIKVKGMSCNHCVMAVTKALNEIEGVKNVKVDLDKGVASYDEVKPVSIDTVREHVGRFGYEVE
ncbi:MAG: cation transporter [Pseudomonadota bacterium]